MEIPKQVGKQGGAVPGALDLLDGGAAVTPGFFVVAAQGKFQFGTQGQHLLGPEVVTHSQSATKGELAVLVNA